MHSSCFYHWDSIYWTILALHLRWRTFSKLHCLLHFLLRSWKEVVTAVCVSSGKLFDKVLDPGRNHNSTWIISIDVIQVQVRKAFRFCCTIWIVLVHLGTLIAFIVLWLRQFLLPWRVGGVPWMATTPFVHSPAQPLVLECAPWLNIQLGIHDLRWYLYHFVSAPRSLALKVLANSMWSFRLWNS